MDYNTEYIETKYALINSFLINANRNVLDISYSKKGILLTIQIVVLAEASLSIQWRNKIIAALNNYEVVIKEVFITKEEFNKNKGDWQPSGYEWLDYLLFSKHEILW